MSASFHDIFSEYIFFLLWYADNFPTMVTGSAAGHMAFWNLESRKLISQQLEAHGKAISGLHCLPQEPLMVSNSGDNTLKVS
jgi:U3 small nucleolar RNA-associated protein 21